MEPKNSGYDEKFWVHRNYYDEGDIKKFEMWKENWSAALMKEDSLIVCTSMSSNNFFFEDHWQDFFSSKDIKAFIHGSRSIDGPQFEFIDRNEMLCLFKTIYRSEDRGHRVYVSRFLKKYRDSVPNIHMLNLFSENKSSTIKRIDC